jgi:hypothetical protein
MQHDALADAHVDQRIVPAVFDVLDLAGDRVRPGAADRQVFRADRHARVRAAKLLLGGAFEPEPQALQGHLISVTRADIEREHVAIAHEARDMQVRGLGINFLRSRDLLHQPVLHHHDAVGERERLVLVVRDVDRGATELAVDAADLGAHLQPQLGVEVRQRLVHQQQRRLDHDRARDRDALLLAAGQLPRQLVLVAGELDQRECARDARLHLVGRRAAHHQAERHVAPDRHVRKQRVVLEHHAEAALLRRQQVDAPLIERDRPAGDRQQAGNAVQRGGLAAA